MSAYIIGYGGELEESAELVRMAAPSGEYELRRMDGDEGHDGFVWDAVIFRSGELPFPRPKGWRIFAVLEQGKESAVVMGLKGNGLRKILFEHDARHRRGKVFLAGFGPGDPELMTRKADRICSICDVIYYDDLIDAESLAQYRAEKVYVGKRKGRHHAAQAEINELMKNAALAGKKVVRLKGGDPYIFGRGGEEVEYLMRHAISVEVIPGVSSMNAAAADYFLPLTQRGISSVTEIRTLHGNPIENHPTRVYYMSASRIKELSVILRSGADRLDASVAIVSDASKPTSKLFRTDAEGLKNATAASPSLVIAGRAAGRAFDPEKWVSVSSEYRALGFMEREYLVSDEQALEKLIAGGAVIDGINRNGESGLL